MAQKTVQVRAVRGFVLAGKLIEPGALVEVTHTQGRELIAAHQAERFDPNDPAHKAASERLVTRESHLPTAHVAQSAPPAESHDPVKSSAEASGRAARKSKPE